MRTLPVRVFKDSAGPFIALLNEHHVRYTMREHRSGEIRASAEIIDLLQSAALWPSLAVVIVAFIASRSSREVMITTKLNAIVHVRAKGYALQEVEKVLPQAKKITAFETEKDEFQPATVEADRVVAFTKRKRAP